MRRKREMKSRESIGSRVPSVTDSERRSPEHGVACPAGEISLVVVIPVAKNFVRFEVALYRHSGGSRNPGKIGSGLYSGQSSGPRLSPG